MILPQPPNRKDYRYGKKLIAGMGESLVIPPVDFETYSPAGYRYNQDTSRFEGPYNAKDKGLKAIGVSPYSEHPEAEVLCMAYDLKDAFGERLWLPGQPLPLDLFLHLQAGDLIEAWNMPFEFYIWNNICVKKYGFPPLSINQVRCAAAKSRAFSLPNSLGDCGAVMGIHNQKDKRGKRLIQLYCIPRTPTMYDRRLRLNIQEYPDDLRDMLNYNLQDIRAEAELSELIPELSPEEQHFWTVGQRINQRGIRLDIPLINAMIKIIGQVYKRYNAELPHLTNNAVTSATQVQRMKKWLESCGTFSPSLDEDHIEILLKTVTKTEVRRVLEIRQLMGSAAVKKLYAMSNRVSADGRVRELFMYHGAHTGRETGAGIQPQNMPKGGIDVWLCSRCKRYSAVISPCPWCGVSAVSKQKKWNADAIRDALEAISSGNVDCLQYYFKDAIATISGCLRGMFIAAEGHDLLCSDYVAIEGVVLACMAGEAWRIKAYATHGLVYEMSASKITGIPLNDFIEYKLVNDEPHPARAKGKVMELSCGYQGWIGAALKFGADEFMTEEEIKQAILAWRAASPMIVRFWKEIESAAHAAVYNPNQEYSYRDITFIKRGTVLFCRLPSGRYLSYHNPELAPNPTRAGQMQLSYEGWSNTGGWQRVTTYGGSLTENIVQAVARDILANAIVNLERMDYEVVLHVHDEIVCEVHEDYKSVAELESIMMELPDWANGWPVRAKGGWRGKRYQK